MNEPKTTPTTCPEDRVLFCPHCSVQHIDFAEPDKCENCGGDGADHEINLKTGKCHGWVAWLNPPHKKHRCKISEGGCGELFKPEDYPTNGVREIAPAPDTEGLTDEPPRPSDGGDIATRASQLLQSEYGGVTGEQINILVKFAKSELSRQAPAAEAYCPNCGTYQGVEKWPNETCSECGHLIGLKTQEAPATVGEVDLRTESLYHALAMLSLEESTRLNSVLTGGFGAIETTDDVKTDMQRRARLLIRESLTMETASLRAALEKAEGELKGAREVIEHYADGGNWTRTWHEGQASAWNVYDDDDCPNIDGGSRSADWLATHPEVDTK